MIRHLVIWKLDHSYTIDEKNEIKKQLHDRLFGLKDKISEIQSINILFNDEEAAPANAEILLDTLFDSLESLVRYQVHPEHVKVAEYIKTFKLQRQAIDYKV